MLKISKLTDYAIIILGHMAQHDDHTCAATELAEATGVATPTVSKILKILAKSEILTSKRGSKGGYALSKSPEQTSIASVICALEGPIALTECTSTKGECQQSTSCQARGNWEVISRAVRTALESVSLADMAKPVVLHADETYIPINKLFQSR